MEFSDYIVYVDESGDHGLHAINRDYPVFVLSFCVFEKQLYKESVIPAITGLKFDTFGHDSVVLHEMDIRKRGGAFGAMNKEVREAFLERLSGIIGETKFVLIAALVDKVRLVSLASHPSNPYTIAMRLGLESLYEFVRRSGQDQRRTHITFESRGRREDAELELEFRRVCDGGNRFNLPMPFEIVMASKQVNSAGLQFADMTARPVGLAYLRPGQPNRAMEILRRKLYGCSGEAGAEEKLRVYP